MTNEEASTFYSAQFSRLYSKNDQEITQF